MKNQVLKKIMAYLLVGAMIISTPMTASANEITDAYSSTEETGSTGSGSGSGSGTQAVPVDPEQPIPDLEKIDAIGIALDKDSLALEAGGSKGRLQARVLFDNYDPKDEPMEWTADPIGYEVKKKIETNVKWKTSDSSVISIACDKEYAGTGNNVLKGTANTKLIVTPKKRGSAVVTAWLDMNQNKTIDADEYTATAVVTVTADVKSVSFEPGQRKFVSGRQYDLGDIYFVTDGLTIRQAEILQYMCGSNRLVLTEFGSTDFNADAMFILNINLLEDDIIKEHCELVEARGSYALVVNNSQTMMERWQWHAERMKPQPAGHIEEIE